MRAYVLKKSGDASVLKISNLKSSTPYPNEVLVKIETIGLNYAEIQSRKGLYGWAVKRPYVLGMEACGTIIKTGSRVNNLQVGQQVIVVSQYGCYAEEVVLPATQVLPVQPGFTSAENAAYAVQFMTAWVALIEICRIRATDRVLIQAAAGGVGTAAVQIAKAMGCQVFGTASNPAKLDLLKSLRIDHAINYSDTDFVEYIHDRTNGEGVDAVLEVVGGDVFRKSLALLNPFGRMAVVGFASLNLKKINPLSWWKTWRDIPRVKIDKMALGSQVVGASHLGYLLQDTERMLKIWNEMTRFTQEHNLKPIIGHEYKFEEMAEAHTLMESRGSHGKIVVHL